MGPAGRSIATRAATARLAAVTHALPAPKILSTAGTDAVPYASAAMAWAPPAFRMRSTPPMRAATSTGAATDPSRPGGVARIELADAGQARRHGEHEDAAGVRRPPAGDVAAGTLDGLPAPPRGDARTGAHADARHAARSRCSAW